MSSHSGTTSTLTTVALLLIAASTVLGQMSDRPAVGAFGAFNHNMHTADFRTLPGVPGCCPLYESGEGSGFSAGLLYDYPLDSAFTLSLRASYMTQDALLTMSESMPVDVDGVLTQADIEHSVDARLSSLGIEPTVAYRVTNRFSVHAGLRLAASLGATYEQQEKLVRPDVGTFENDRRIRNEYTGDIPDASTFSVGLLLGLSYELPLDDTGELSASPEVSYLYGLTPVISSYTWSAHSLRAGVALRYRISSPMEAPPTPPAAVPQPPPPRVKQPALLANISAAGLEDGKEMPVVRIRVEEFVSTNMRPLLPCIFFEENSAEIPDRYTALRSEETGAFRVDDMHTAGTLDVYHNLLNIIGQRLREHPEASITLTGCNADVDTEQGNRELSRARAEAVAAYIAQTWGIEARRLKIAAQDLPRIPSNPREADGVAENRRVEITSTDNRILQPVTTRSTERQVTPGHIVFSPAIHSEAGVSDWSVSAHQAGAVLASFTGSGTPPLTLTWDLAEQFRNNPIEAQAISYSCAASDATGQHAQSIEHTLPVEYITLQNKRKDTEHPDKEISRYSLILFDFDKSELGQQNRAILTDIRKDVRPSSTVRIIGYTDRIGETEYNKLISEQRAKSTADALGVKSAEILGFGESVPLFDNDLPEGRFYSRTVHIQVETPVGR